jgi:hypothetical protein
MHEKDGVVALVEQGAEPLQVGKPSLELGVVALAKRALAQAADLLPKSFPVIQRIRALFQ